MVFILQLSQRCTVQYTSDLHDYSIKRFVYVNYCVNYPACKAHAPFYVVVYVWFYLIFPYHLKQHDFRKKKNY